MKIKYVMILFIFEIKYYHTRTIMILYVVSWFIIRPCGELIFILKIIHFSGLGANLKIVQGRESIIYTQRNIRGNILK